MLHDLTGQMMPGAMANAYLVFSMMPAINLHFGFPSLAGFFAEAVEGGEMKADYAQVEPVLGSLIKAAASHVDTSIATTITEAKAAMDPDGAQLAKMKAEGEANLPAEALAVISAGHHLLKGVDELGLQTSVDGAPGFRLKFTGMDIFANAAASWALATA